MDGLLMPSSTEKRREQYRAWSARNKEHRREYERERRANRGEEERERRREYTAQWRADRPHCQRITQAARTARKFGVASTLTHDEWLAILAEYNEQCAYCFAPWEHLDHVVEMSKGGPNTKENVVPACADCNHRKGHNTGWVPSIASRFWPPTDDLVPAQCKWWAT